MILRKDKTKNDLIQYHHAACFSPTKKTFLEAIKRNHLQSFPGLTAEAVRKHLIDTVHTAKGHLNQEASGLQSTKTPVLSQEENSFDKEDFYPNPSTSNIKTKDVIYSIMNTTDKAFLDLTGRFPHCSSRGNQYILVGYHHDANNI